MRLYGTLIAGLIALAFTAGYLGLNLNQSKQATQVEVREITRLKMAFVNTQNVETRINLSKLYSLRGQFELIRSNNFLETHFGDAKKNIWSDYNRCHERLMRATYEYPRQKAFLWNDYLCRRSFKLPSSFFYTAPFLHPSGVSFAYMALESPHPEFKTKKWLRQHLSFFHLYELGKVKEYLKTMPREYETLAALDIESIQAIANRDQFFLTDEHLWLKNIKFLDNGGLEYSLFNRNLLQDFLKNSKYRVSKYSSLETCHYRDKSICWNYSFSHFLNTHSTRNKILLVLTFVLLIFLGFILWLKIRDGKKEDKRQRLALQVLGHEFRTPVSSMLLQLESIQGNFDQLPDSMQESFLRLSGDVYRLQRLTEMSRQYLRSQGDKKSVSFNVVKIESLKEYLEEILYDYPEFKFEMNDDDMGLMTDPYWLKLCLDNLMKNAKLHGAPDYLLRVTRNEEEVLFDVIDHGKCHFNELKEMKKEFVKGTQSEGTGLGLNIVATIIKDMGGEFTFKSGPTIFTIKLRI